MGWGVIAAILVAIPLSYLLAIIFPDSDAPTSFEWWGFWLPLAIGSVLGGLVWPRGEILTCRNSAVAAMLIALCYVALPLLMAVLVTSLLQPVFDHFGNHARGSWISSFGFLPVIVLCLLAFLTSFAGLWIGLWLRHRRPVA